MSNGVTVKEKLTSHKMLAGLIWGGLNVLLVALEPIVRFDKELVKLFNTNSTYITGALILGFAGVSVVDSWSKTKSSNGDSTPVKGNPQGGQT